MGTGSIVPVMLFENSADRGYTTRVYHLSFQIRPFFCYMSVLFFPSWPEEDDELTCMLMTLRS